MDAISQPHTVTYLDSWGEETTDRFATEAEAQARVDYLEERGRQARLGRDR